MLGAVAVTKSDSASSKNEKKAVPWYKKLSFTDYAFGAFILVCTISTVFSQDPYDAFFGISGRNNGLFLMMKHYDDNGPTIDMVEQNANKDKIINTLRSFGIEISTIKATVGPTVTLYEITPEQGVRISNSSSIGYI